MRQHALQPPTARRSSTEWVLLHRPVQWTKNAVVLSALVFGGQAGSSTQIARALIAVVAFCLASSAGYIWNDWRDRERDRLHPEKRLRPIASGRIRPRSALLWSVVLLFASLILSALVSPLLSLVVATYTVLMATYTARLKHLPVIDVVIIATGFVLRAIAGAVAVAVPMSRWLVVCTFLLALFLGFGKRRHELVALGNMAVLHRPALGGYSKRMLNVLIALTAGLTLAAYIGYAATTPTVTTHWPMLLTVPLVAFAIGRYLILVLRRDSGGSPELLLLRDVPLIVAIVCWSLAIGAILVVFQDSSDAANLTQAIASCC